MSKIKNLGAGLAGAIALNVLHESLRKIWSDAPKIHLVGEEALNKTLSKVDATITNEKDLYTATLISDVASNAVYYSLIGGNSKNIWPKAIILGLTAGIGALKLPEPLGLNDEPVNKTTETKALTIGYYLFGAIVTALVLKALKNN